MTEKELSAIFYLDKQIAGLRRRIAELPADTLGRGGDLSGTRSSSPGDPTGRLAEKKITLLEKLTKALEDRIDAEIAIQAFINRVQDEEIKLIMTYRCIDLMSWEEIGKELYADRTTVSKKFRSYLKNIGNSHISREKDV